MKCRIHHFLIVIILLAAGCATEYRYYSVFETDLTAATSSSQPQKRQVVLYWNATDNLLWFDKSDQAIGMLPRQSAVKFEFRDGTKDVDGVDGVVLLKRPGMRLKNPSGRLDAEHTICGWIPGIQKVEDIRAGPIQIEIFCELEIKPSPNFFIDSGTYTAIVKKLEKDEAIKKGEDCVAPGQCVRFDSRGVPLRAAP